MFDIALSEARKVDGDTVGQYVSGIQTATIRLRISSLSTRLRQSSRQNALRAFLPLLRGNRRETEAATTTTMDRAQHEGIDDATLRLVRELQEREEQVQQDAELARALQAAEE